MNTIVLIPVFAQSDSLIRFSDLSFHSDFEKEAIKNFVFQNRDTFNLFLAIDENITREEANRENEIYFSNPQRWEYLCGNSFYP